jgi:chemotaxis protein methyltransferase CheR
MVTSLAAFDLVRDLVRRRAAIVLEDGKDYLLRARLEPVAREQGLSGFEELIAQLESGASEQLKVRVVEAMATHETRFFREPPMFEALAKEVLPALFEARRVNRQLRIWSAGCSTGQEPYSVAMTVRENLPTGSAWDVSILATDLSEQAVDRARGGSYRSAELNRGMPDAYRDKYLMKAGDDWVVGQELRTMVTARPMNLAATWPPIPTMDIVLLRNVLMYLSTNTRRSILRKLCSIVAPDGYLFLGSSESSGHLDARWEPTRQGRVVYYRPHSKELAE